MSRAAAPLTLKLTSTTGVFTEARILYYDPTHDFGFYQIDPAEVDFALKAVELGEWDSLSLGDELLLHREQRERGIYDQKLRRILFLEADGVYLPHAERGSSFSRVGVQERNGNSKIVILDINGKQIRNLDDFIEACKTITDGQHTYVVVRDFNLFDSSPTPKSLTVNLKFGPLQQFEWNQEVLDWKNVSSTGSFSFK